MASRLGGRGGCGEAFDRLACLRRGRQGSRRQHARHHTQDEPQRAPQSGYSGMGATAHPPASRADGLGPPLNHVILILGDAVHRGGAGRGGRAGAYAGSHRASSRICRVS